MSIHSWLWIFLFWNNSCLVIISEFLFHFFTRQRDIKDRKKEVSKAKRLVRPGQLAGNSERARGIFFFKHEPLSVEMAGLLGIQNEIQAVWKVKVI